jgi:hypothetical protein
VIRHAGAFIFLERLGKDQNLHIGLAVIEHQHGPSLFRLFADAPRHRGGHAGHAHINIFFGSGGFGQGRRLKVFDDAAETGQRVAVM